MGGEIKLKKSTIKAIVIALLLILILAAGYFAGTHLGKNSTPDASNNTGKPLGEPLPADIYKFPDRLNDRGLNLVFYADNYTSWREFRSDISALMSVMNEIEPWKSYTNWNIYEIKPVGDLSPCIIENLDEAHRVLKCNEKMNDYLKKLPIQRFKLIVLSRRDFISWGNLARLQNSAIFFSIPQLLDIGQARPTGYLFAHLFGAAFGLKDEEKFIITTGTGAEPTTPNGPNCAPDIDTAMEWWGDLVAKDPGRVGYFKTCCGSDQYYKPTEGSIMNLNELGKFVPDYGPVSERYLKKIVDYCFSPLPPKEGTDPEFFSQYPEFKECLKK